MFSLMPWRKETGLVPREADPFGLMWREIGPIFDHFLGGLPMAYAEEWERPVWDLEVLSEEKEIVVRVEAPGFEVADFDVRVMGELLTILAEHKEAKEKGEKKASRFHARLERTVILPPALDIHMVEALYRNGVLELHLPKLPEAEGKKIEVKA